MSAAVEARMLISDIAGPMRAGAQIQEMLSAVALATGLGHRRLRGIWNSEARAIRSEEMDILRRAVAARAAAARNKREAQEAIDRDEYRQLQREVVQMRKRLAEINSILAGAEVDEAGPSFDEAGGRELGARRGTGGTGTADRAVARSYLA